MDLAKRDLRGTSLPQRTFRQDTTLPRQDTSQPALEVNAPIVRPDMSGADALSHILGLANDVGQNISNDIAARKRADQAASGAADAAAGTKNDSLFKVRAYREAWQFQGAKRLSVDIGTEATAYVNSRLNDSDHPATLEELDHGIESIFQKHTTDPTGKLLDFGPAEAKITLANSLNEIRSNLLPQAQAAIKKQTDTRLLSTLAYNTVNEYYRGGTPVGSPTPPKPLVDPLAVLPDGQDAASPPTHTVYYAPGTPGQRPLSPFSGFTTLKPSSVMGAPREGGSSHNGEDFPVAVGTQIVAPTQGTVVAAFTNARGGNQVRLRMADGAIVGFAHLSKVDVKQGDSITAGQQLGLSGQTGHATGPHVHVTVEVGGKKVSPTAYFKGATVPSGLPSGPAYVATGAEPVLDTVSPAGAPEELPPFDFEKALAQVPPSISKTEAKQFLIQSLINEANKRGDIGLLRGLEDSKRPTGEPTLAPDEVATIQQAREVISNRVRVQADQKRQALWEKNGNTVINSFLSDTPPGIGWLRSQAHAGLINPELAYSMENHIESEGRAQASEARSDARAARAEADAAYDADAAGIVALRSAGDVGDASADADVALLKSGKLGVGKRALMRFNQLRAAAHAGERQNLENPNVSVYAGQLKQNFGNRPKGFLEQSLQGGLQANIVGMMGWYMSEVKKGIDPSQAYFDTVQKFAPKSKDAAALRDQRIQELRAKRLLNQ